jgi:hypothetical protein
MTRDKYPKSNTNNYKKISNLKKPIDWQLVRWRIWYQIKLPFKFIGDLLARLFTIYRVAFLLASIAVFLTYYYHIDFETLLPNIVTDLFGIALAVFIIDSMYRLRSDYERKRILISKLGSKNNTVASDALHELDAEGWLSDGSLVKAYLGSCNLDGNTFSGADLRRVSFSFASLKDTKWLEADLTGAFLDHANLTKATLSVHAVGPHFAEANLTDAFLAHANLGLANVRPEQLCRVRTLWRAIMPNGLLYDGCYNLRDDIEHYLKFATDPSDPQEWASYYGVTPEQYVLGQEWAMINLDRLRKINST